MTEKKVPFTAEQIKNIIKEYPTPFHIYDEKVIRENARRKMMPEINVPIEIFLANLTLF